MSEVLLKKYNLKIGKANPLVLIAGPCVIESEEITLKTAEEIKKITQKHNVPFIFKSSYSKANRMDISSFVGPGMDKGLEILKKVKERIGVPILTDIHQPNEAAPVSQVADIIQIPAFLCRQTDLVLSAAKTGKPINIKKGQFMAPEDMKQIVDKVCSTGNKDVLITERGTTFGYHNLIVDMRSLVILREFGYPIVFDATHSLQLPGGQGNFSGGQPQFILPMSRAAVACGIDALFIETHPQVEKALCDGKNMLALDKLEDLVVQIWQINQLIREIEK
jgi:2-dehydro-3-deoxyphosphooctonate aldolase (KDO 8-P synthase)